MASSSLAPYFGNTASTDQYTYALVSQSSTGATYKVAGRDLATPHGVEIIRKLTPASSPANDHVQLRVFRVERNTTTSKLATAQVLVDISIPKDTSILTQAEQAKMVRIVGSILAENCGALSNDTFTSSLTLLSGGDL